MKVTVLRMSIWKRGMGKERLVVAQPHKGKVGHQGLPVAERRVAGEANKGVDKDGDGDDGGGQQQDCDRPLPIPTGHRVSSTGSLQTSEVFHEDFRKSGSRI